MGLSKIFFRIFALGLGIVSLSFTKNSIANYNTASPHAASIVSQNIITQPAISATPTPTNAPTPTQQPTSIPLQNIGDQKQLFIMQAINAYRQAKGLSPVTSNSETCNFAAIRATEVSSNFSHNGFTERIASHTLPYASYTLITENLAETDNYQDVVNMWANSPEHAANMQADTPYVCVAYSGNYYAYEGWKP